MKILLSAFSCAPSSGSEPGIGWGVVQQAAERHLVWVLTDVHNRPYINAQIRQSPLENAQFVFVELPWGGEPSRSGKCSQSLHYVLWQWFAFRAAHALHQKVGFDVVHHVTYGNSWLPSWMGRLGAPFIWSAGAKDRTPWRFCEGMSWRSRLTEIARNAVMSAMGYITEHSTAPRARMILSASDTGLWRKDLPVRCFALGGLSPEEMATLCRIPPRHAAPFRVASIGRLLGWKGFALSVRAFAKLHAEYPLTEYWIIGDGPERSKLQRTACQSGCHSGIHFLGVREREEVFRLLPQIDVLLHPSLHEQFGYVLLEAMSAGRPVIALNIAGPRNLAAEGAGVLIEPSSPAQVVEEIYGHLRRMALHPEERIEEGLRARRWVREQWTWDVVGRRLLALYDEATGQARRTAPSGSSVRQAAPQWN